MASRSRLRTIARVLFIASGLFPVLLLVLDENPSLLLYSVFVVVYILRRSGPMFGWQIPYLSTLFLFISIWMLGLISEWLFWLEVQLSGEADPGVQPDAAAHLGGFSVFYGIKAFSWALLLSRFRFSLAQIIITQGFFGIAIEQQGAILLQTVVNPLTIVWWPYLLAFYTSYVAIPYLLVEDRLAKQRKLDHWIKYPLALVVPLVLMFLATMLTTSPEEGGQ